MGRMETKIKGYIRNAVEVFKIKFANRESADIAKFVKAYVMASLHTNDDIDLSEAERLYRQHQPDVLELKQMQHHNR